MSRKPTNSLKAGIVAAALLLAMALAALAAYPARAEGIAWLSYEQALQKAAQAPRPILVYFHIPYCYRCKELKRTLYREPAIINALNNRFWPAKVDISQDAGESMANRFQVDYTPYFVFLDSSGKSVLRHKGMISKKRFLKMLGFVVSGAYQKTDFASYAGTE